MKLLPLVLAAAAGLVLLIVLAACLFILIGRKGKTEGSLWVEHVFIEETREEERRLYPVWMSYRAYIVCVLTDAGERRELDVRKKDLAGIPVHASGVLRYDRRDCSAVFVPDPHDPVPRRKKDIHRD